MDKQDSSESNIKKENNNPYNNSAMQTKKFLVELTVSQSQALNRLLPKTYTLLIQRQVKTKRNAKKKYAESKKQANSFVGDIDEPSQRIKKVPSHRYTQQIIEFNNCSRASSQGYYQDIEDYLKPCLKIVNLLKGHRSSWPFKQPVDPISLNIPNYLEIVKEPMDLQTVEQNIKAKAYATAAQFHGDIKKIIRNSYQFNKKNPDFLKLTSQFEKFYLKVSTDASNRGSSVANSGSNIGRKKSKNNSRPNQLSRQMGQLQPVTLAQKRELAQEIRKLPKQYLLEIAQVVYKDKIPTSQELNLQALPTPKIRQLQKLVKEKLAYLKIHTENVRAEEPNADLRSEQSSFESDSDS